jgi:hypothetical protein
VFGRDSFFDDPKGTRRRKRVILAAPTGVAEVVERSNGARAAICDLGA